MKVALMSTFFTGHLLNYLKWYCEELLTYFNQVVLLVHQPLLPIDRDFLQSTPGLTEHVLPENRGLDFGAYYHSRHYLDHATHAALVNDSCIPFRSFQPFFTWFDKNNCDYAGLTNNLEFNYHIQSYFVLLRGPAIKLTQDFIQQHGVLKNRQQIIQEYEIGLSRWLPDQGVKIGAMYDCKLGKVNWTMKKPVELIERGFPMIKRKVGIMQYADLLRNIANTSCDNVNIDYILEGLEKDVARQY